MAEQCIADAEDRESLQQQLICVYRHDLAWNVSEVFLDHLGAAVSVGVVDADDPVVSQLGPLPTSHSTTPTWTCPVASVSMDGRAGNGRNVEE